MSVNPFQYRLANKKILIIDDDQSILTATNMLISKWGCVAEIASNVYEASPTCDYFLPDDIISDLRLKGDVTGIEVIEQLRLQFNQNMPAILITDDTASDSQSQCVDAFT